MALNQVTDHVDQGLGLVLSQYQNKPRFAALLTSYLQEVQELDDATWNVLMSRLIDYAVGVQLDTVGEIVGEPRRDHDDDTYRRFIKVRILVNRSDGRLDTLLAILDVIESTPVFVTEPPPANMLFEFLNPTTVPPSELMDILRDSKGGGIGLQIVVPTTAGHDFEYADASDPSSFDDPAHAYGDAANLTGTDGLASSAYK